MKCFIFRNTLSQSNLQHSIVFLPSAAYGMQVQSMSSAFFLFLCLEKKQKNIKATMFPVFECMYKRVYLISEAWLRNGRRMACQYVPVAASKRKKKKQHLGGSLNKSCSKTYKLLNLSQGNFFFSFGSSSGWSPTHQELYNFLTWPFYEKIYEVASSFVFC